VETRDVCTRDVENSGHDVANRQQQRWRHVTSGRELTILIVFKNIYIYLHLRTLYFIYRNKLCYI
jgi:hypothetical protein